MIDLVIGLMPSYSGNNSPSLQKMDYSAGRHGGKRFDFGNIVGDPFSLATIGIAIVSNMDTDMDIYGLRANME